MKRFKLRLFACVLTAIMLATSLPVDMLAYKYSGTIPGFEREAIGRPASAKTFIDSDNDKWADLSFDLAGDAEGQSIMTKKSNATHGASGWNYFTPTIANGSSGNNPGYITSEGSADGSKYLKIDGNEYFQMITNFYAVTNNKNAAQGYELNFRYKSAVTSVTSPNAFFFRGDSGDFEAYRKPNYATLNYYESDSLVSSGDTQTQKFIGGSGIGLWVSGKHTLTLVIKKALTGSGYSNRYVDNVFVNFQVQEDLTQWNDYRIVDNGREYLNPSSNKEIYNSLATITFYLNGRLLFIIEGRNYGTLGMKTHLWAQTGADEKTITFAEKAAITDDTSMYYRTCSVKDAGGIELTTVDNSLIRNYSRFCFVSRGGSGENSEMCLDNFTAQSYDSTNEADVARVNGYNQVTTNDAIYLPITIRDYAADGMLFEFNEMWFGNYQIKYNATRAEVLRRHYGKIDPKAARVSQNEALYDYNYEYTRFVTLAKNINGTSYPDGKYSSTYDANGDYYTFETEVSNGDAYILADFGSIGKELKADNYGSIVVRYKTSNTNASDMGIFFQNGDGGRDGGKRVGKSLNKDGNWHNLVFNMKSNANWTGNIKKIWFDFTDNGNNNGSTIDIQYVAICINDNGNQMATDDAYYPYHSFTNGFSKKWNAVGKQQTLTISTHRYMRVRYKTSDVTSITARYTDTNGNAIASSASDYKIYNDNKWHDLFIKIATGSDAYGFKLDYSGTLKICSVAAMNYADFEGTYTAGWSSGGDANSHTYRDKYDQQMIFLYAYNRNGLTLDDLGTVNDQAVYYANVRYKTGADKLYLNVETRGDNFTIESSMRLEIPDVRNDGQWHTAAVELKAMNWKGSQIYVSSSNGSTLDCGAVAFLQYSKKDGSSKSVEEQKAYCKFYATFYNPAVDYAQQQSNHIAFGLALEQKTTGNGNDNYTANFTKTGDAYLFGINGTGTIRPGSQNYLKHATSYNVSNRVNTSYGTLIRGIAVQGLTEATLVNGKPVYKQGTVEFLANVLAYALKEGTQNSAYAEGYLHHNMIIGEVNDELYGKGKDFAALLRSKLNDSTANGLFGAYAHYEVGDYNTAKSRNYNLSNFKNGAKGSFTCMDVALYMLNSLYVTGQDQNRNVTGTGYSMEISNYNNLALVRSVDNNGKYNYTFSSGFAGTKYDEESKSIYNTQTVSTPYYKIKSGQTRVSPLPDYNYMFNPLGSSRNSMQGMGGSKTALGYGDTDPFYLGEDATTINSPFGDRYTGFNYNFSMEGHAAFVYHEADNLYFRFMGDDDVYLFINNQLVLDIGGAHSRTDVELYVNDVKNKLGLVEGESYEFRFFYMERHGIAANFAIQTNIRLSSPDMPVEKDCYLEGEQLEFGDNVQDSDKLQYTFSAENISKDTSNKIEYMQFTDSALGFTLGYDNASDSSWRCELGSYTPKGGSTTNRQLSELTIIITDSTGKTVNTYSNLDLGSAKSVLKKGITSGQKMTIKGVIYYLTQSNIDQNTFVNTVSVRSQFDQGGGQYKALEGNAQFVVNISDLWIYLWEDHNRTYSITDVISDSTRIGSSTYGALKKDNTIGVYISDANKNKITSGDHKITAGTTLSGAYQDGYNISDTKVTSNVKNTGTTSYFFTLIAQDPTTQQVQKFGPYGVTVFTYGLSDVTYVLDYGLPVTVYADPGEKDGTPYLGGSGDTLSLSTNGDELREILGFKKSAPTATTSGTVEGYTSNFSETGTYGSFAGTAGSTAAAATPLTYTPSKFLHGSDDVYVAVGITDETCQSTDNAQKYSVKYGIQMYKKISFVPAYVVYYEENIGSIVYSNGLNTGKVTGTTQNTQSSNQNENYGYDKSYLDDTTTVDTIEKNSQFKWYTGLGGYTFKKGIGGFDGVGNNYNFSNGTYAALYTDATDYSGANKNATFTFNGTGFELISFTNLSSAMVRVVVKKNNGDIEKQKIVITQYVNGHLDQVPIISIRDLPYNEYTVEIYVSKPVNGKGTRFYLDGVRIYDPVKNDSNITNHYKEQNVTIEELRANILKNNPTVGIVDFVPTGDGTGTQVSFSAGNSVVERIDTYWKDELKDGEWSFSDSDGTYSYANVGPNNEVYLMGNRNALVFRVLPNDGVSVEDVVLEIEAKKASGNDLGWYEYVGYDIATEKLTLPATSTKITSYTAMYHSIDVSKCINNVDGSYTVIVMLDRNDDDEDSVVSVSNIKYAGCTLEEFNLGDVVKGGAVATSLDAEIVKSVMGVMLAANEGYQINENITIDSVSAAVAYEYGENVVVSVIASANATSVKAVDENGNEVEIVSQNTVAYGEKAMMSVDLGVLEAGTYKYTFTALDKDGRESPMNVVKTITVEE